MNILIYIPDNAENCSSEIVKYARCETFANVFRTIKKKYTCKSDKIYTIFSKVNILARNIIVVFKKIDSLIETLNRGLSSKMIKKK